MPATAAIVRRWQIRKFLGEAVRCDVETIAGSRAVARSVAKTGAGRATEKVNAVTSHAGDVVGAADHTQRDIGHVVVGSPTVRKTSAVSSQTAEPLLILRLRRGDL